MKVTVIMAAVRRVLSNPVVREFGRTVRRHLKEDVLQEAIEVIARLVRGSTRAKAHAETEER